MGTQRVMGDTLHSLFLGVFQTFLAFAFEALQAANAWQAPRHLSGQAVLEFSVEAFKSGLFVWYSEYERLHTGTMPTRVQELTASMVRGKHASPTMDLKASETKWCC